MHDFLVQFACSARDEPLRGYGGIGRRTWFEFVRITPTSRRANSSSAFSEGWGVNLHNQPGQTAANRTSGAFIQYADLTELMLMLMLDMSLGGGFMDAVNEGQRLIRPRA